MPLTDSQLTTEANIIRNETVSGANTALRVGTMLDDIIGNKVNNDKISTDGTFASNSDLLVPSQKAAKTYVDASVVGLLNDRGNYDASGNVFPSSGGSGGGGAIVKGNIWLISVAGVLGGVSVGVGYWLRALTNTPGQTAGNWAISNVGLGYVAENQANKSTDTTLGGLTPSNTLYPSQSAVSGAIQGIGVHTTKVTISSADIKQSNDVILTIIPAPGSGKMIALLNAISVYQKGATTYTLTGFQPNLAYTNFGSGILLLTNGVINGGIPINAGSTRTTFHGIGGGQYSYMDFDASIMNNSGICFYTYGGNPTLGDGTIDLYLTYKILDI